MFFLHLLDSDDLCNCECIHCRHDNNVHYLFVDFSQIKRQEQAKCQNHKSRRSSNIYINRRIIGCLWICCKLHCTDYYKWNMCRTWDVMPTTYNSLEIIHCVIADGLRIAGSWRQTLWNKWSAHSASSLIKSLCVLSELLLCVFYDHLSYE